ncbi:transposase [Parafrankia sp. FMc2]|uniref:transposase n=1 Tax=Parafrankia sp. FMc2 TaxID=3233196 RepID=UPI0034D71F62
MGYLAAATGAWIVFEDEAGQSLRPPKARTWAPRGHTPTVRVSGKGSGRVSMAALVCYRPGQRPRMFYRVLTHHGRKGERRSFSEDDYATLIAAAHHQLRAPLILCWDNLNTHRSAAMRVYLTRHARWLTVIPLPAYAPDLNPSKACGPTSNATSATTSASPSTSSPPRSRPCSNAFSTGPT